MLTQTFERAVSDARHRHIPALVIVNVVRLESHSNSDNQAKYRSEEDLSCCQAQDPLVRLEKSLLDDFGVAHEVIEQIKAELQETVNQACELAESAPFPCKGATKHEVFAPYNISLIDYEMH